MCCASYKINYESCGKAVRDIDLVVEELHANDNQYHERPRKRDILKLFVDIDKLHQHCLDKDFHKDVVPDISDFLGLEASDVSFTKNHAVEGSHHVVFPHHYMHSSKQKKKLWLKFRDKYGFGKTVDAELFDKDTWFRLPKQTKRCKWRTEHVIEKGEMKHFVMKDIAEESKEYVCGDLEEAEKPTRPLKPTKPLSIKSPTSTATTHSDTEEEEYDKYLELLFSAIKNDSDAKGTKRSKASTKGKGKPSPMEHFYGPYGDFDDGDDDDEDDYFGAEGMDEAMFMQELMAQMLGGGRMPMGGGFDFDLGGSGGRKSKRSAAKKKKRADSMTSDNEHKKAAADHTSKPTASASPSAAASSSGSNRAAAPTPASASASASSSTPTSASVRVGDRVMVRNK